VFHELGGYLVGQFGLQPTLDLDGREFFVLAFGVAIKLSALHGRLAFSVPD